MKVFAPGKLVLTGAYAVLSGAPAIVFATNRGVYADGERTHDPLICVYLAPPTKASTASAIV